MQQAITWANVDPICQLIGRNELDKCLPNYANYYASPWVVEQLDPVTIYHLWLCSTFVMEIHIPRKMVLIRNGTLVTMCPHEKYRWLIARLQ